MKTFSLTLGSIIAAGCLLMLATGSTWVSSGNNYATTASLVTTTTNTLAFDTATSSGGYETKRSRTLQNCGVVPVLYCLGSTVSITNYHGVLAAGLVARDGLGSVVSLGDWRGQVSIAVESGTGVVSTLEVVQ